MNINRIIQGISGTKLGSASVTFPTTRAEFYVEMLDIEEYQRLVDSAGVDNISCAFAANGTAHEVYFQITSEVQEFQLSF